MSTPHRSHRHTVCYRRLFHSRQGVLRLQRVVTMAGMTALLAVAIMLLSLVWRDGIQVVQVGGWPAPVGITFVADLFSAIMVTLAGLMGITVVTFSLVNMIDSPSQWHIIRLSAFVDGCLRCISKVTSLISTSGLKCC